MIQEYLKHRTTMNINLPEMKELAEVELNLKEYNYIKLPVIDSKKQVMFKSPIYSITPSSVTLIKNKLFELPHEDNSLYDIVYKEVNLIDYYYIYNQRFEKEHPSLRPMSVYYKYKAFINKAILIGATDIKLQVIDSKVSCFLYYHCKWEEVNININSTEFYEVIDLLAFRENFSTRINKEVNFNTKLAPNINGRVNVINIHRGVLITIRVLREKVLTINSLSELNMSPKAISLFTEQVLTKESGLRLFIGGTNSGKSTTILGILQHYIKNNPNSNIISIEYPLEVMVKGITQIHINNEEEFTSYTKSLVRVNPDLLYISEINEYSKDIVLRVSNLGKPVYASIHANSIIDSLFRIQDLTNYPIPKIVTSIHSLVFQRLTYEDGKYKPSYDILIMNDKIRQEVYKDDNNVYDIIGKSIISNI